MPACGIAFEDVFLVEVITLMQILRGLWLGLVAMACLVATTPVCAGDVDKYLPDDTDVVIGVNLKQILDSGLFKKHGQDKFKELIKSNAEVGKVIESLGFDPLKDLSSVTMALVGLIPEPKPLIIVRGNFDPAKFAAKAEEISKSKGDKLKIHKSGEHKIYEMIGDDPKPTFAGMVDKNTIVAAQEKESVEAAFETAAGKSKGKGLRPDMKELMEKIDTKQSLFVAVPASTLKKLPEPPDEKSKKTIEKILSATVGLTVDTDLKLAITIASKSADAAKELAEEIKENLEQAKGLVALVAGMKPELAPLVDVVGALKVAAESNNVIIKSEVSGEMIEKALKMK